MELWAAGVILLALLAGILVLTLCGKKIHKVAAILTKAVSELSGGHYPMKKDAAIYSKITGKPYNINMTVKDSDIRNGSEIILI